MTSVSIAAPIVALHPNVAEADKLPHQTFHPSISRQPTLKDRFNAEQPAAGGIHQGALARLPSTGLQTQRVPEGAGDHRSRLIDAATRVRAQAKKIFDTPFWAQVGRLGALTAVACCVSISVGLVSAGTITPWFLRLTLPEGTVVSMFSQVPLIGSFLTGIIQRGGPFGALCSSLVLWFSTRAMFSQGGTQDRRRDWLLSAATAGVALSPVFVPGVPVTGALAAGCLLGAAAMAYLTSRAHMPQGNGDWRINIVAIAVGVAFAPMGAQASMLVSQAAILGEALTITTICSLGIAIHALTGLIAPLFRENVAAARNPVAFGTKELQLDRPGVAQPTVFGSKDVPDLLDYMDSLAEDMQHNIAWRSRFIVLRGAEGTGKQSIAMAELLRLGMPIEFPSRETLRSSGNPSSALREFFEKCKERARVTHKPVAIFIKDIDHLLGLRQQGDADNDQMVNAALLYLTQLDGATPSNLLIVGTLVSGRSLDGALASRATLFDVPEPSADTLKQIFSTRFAKAMRTSPLHTKMAQEGHGPTWQLPQDLLDTVGDEAVAQKLSGRDLDRYAETLCGRVRASGRSFLFDKSASAPSFDWQTAAKQAHGQAWPKMVREQAALRAQSWRMGQ